MPYLDEDFYHQFRWYKPIPVPRAYGDMIVTATSRRANLNEQPRKRYTTPRRATTPRRSSSRMRYGSPVPPPHQQSYDEHNDPWAAPTPEAAKPVPHARHKAAPPELRTTVTPAGVLKRNKMTLPTAFNAARETLSHYVPTTVEPVPRPVPPPAIPISTDISTAVAPPVNLMTQSWQVISGFPVTPSPPLPPPDLADLWLQRPPERFTSLLPPTHPSGQHSLLREDSPFRLYSQLPLQSAHQM